MSGAGEGGGVVAIVAFLKQNVEISNTNSIFRVLCYKSS